MKQQTWEERFDDMVAEYAVDFYMQNTGESFDGHWLREEHVSKMVKAELQRQRQEIIELIKNERTAAISPPADEWINKWRLLNKLEGK